MRAHVASRVFVLLATLSFSGFAGAQSSQTGPQPPQESLQKRTSPAKPFVLAAATGAAHLQGRTDSADGTVKPLPVHKNWSILLQRPEDGPRFLQRFGSGPDAPNCAHIRIFQAPDMDSEMVIEATPGTGGEITTLKGLPPCSRDLPSPLTVQRLPGLPPTLPAPGQMPYVVPPAASKVPAAQPGLVQPKPSEAPGQKP